MKKGFGLVLLGVYAISTVFFCGNLSENPDSFGVLGSRDYSGSSEFSEASESSGTSESSESSGALESSGTWESSGASEEKGKGGITATELGVMCISSAYPNISFELADSRDNESQPDTPATVISDSEKEKPEPVVFGDDPVVLIVHTHATESYLPASEGNYHTQSSENSVRDVGQVLAKTLEAEGIACVHDQTLHDSPSYNQSYSRSYETTQALLKKYPTIQCVIDLHRDAIASDTKAATVSIGGKQCAKYSYVVSNAVETYESNLTFIKHMNETATDDYSGFTGKVLERGYRYNQNLSSRYMLLEIGYNRNDIEEARNTAEIFAKVLADTLKAGY